MDLCDVKKPHRKRQAGPKLDKKKEKEKKNDVSGIKPKNPKAFAFHSIKKTERAVRRTADVKEKKFHTPMVDRTSTTPPPVIVAVVGPPKVGKSTLIYCLIRNFIRRKVPNIQGPITIVTSKKQRITFIECNNDLNSMIDIAKIADLVLLLVDASFGFEMEIFEFLHITKIHGEIKVIGVLTHLDLIDNGKKLKKTKKKLKERFWKDVYPGAKLFYLSGMVNGEYQKMEVHNLGRFISVMKYRPLVWRSSHSYVLVDRVEDVTDPEKIRSSLSTCDRSVCFYGYIRGTNLKNKTPIHIPGIGDHVITEVNSLDDPCPLPDQLKKRSLNEKERLVYGPMSGVGGVMFDRDAVYIDAKGSHSLHENRRSKDEDDIFTSLKTIKGSLDAKIEAGKFHMFSSFKDERKENDMEGVEENDEGKKEIDEETNEEKSDGSEEEYDEEKNEKNKDKKNIKDRRRPWDEEEEEDGEYESEEESEKEEEEEDEDEEDNMMDDEEEIGHLKWKNNLREKGIASFLSRLNNVDNMQQFVYGENIQKQNNKRKAQEEENEENYLSGMFTLAKDNKERGKVDNEYEQSNFLCDKNLLLDFTKDQNKLDELISQVKNNFASGDWGEEDAEKVLRRDEEFKKKREEDNDEDDWNSEEESGLGGDEENEENNEEENEKETPEERRERRMKEKLMKRKMRQKQMFDDDYDDEKGENKNYFETLKEEMAAQSELNRSEFENLPSELRVALEGFRQGTYVRVQVDQVPCQFIFNLNPSYPLLIGGLLPGEQNIGYVTVKMKKHRWYKRILKTNDPLIVSIGWRRFQTIPIFSVQDHNGRNRQIKYTPNHLHCHATFWGPISPQGTGIVSVESLASDGKDFRLSGMGAVCEVDGSFDVVKKLKLVGTPYLVHRNTAFIQGMFNSELEVAKFENAHIRTVSGIRGQIKKSVKNGSTLVKKFKNHLENPIQPGTFRATFEDKILMKDLVFMRTWCRTSVTQFYNPVTNLLLPLETRDAWKGMKRAGEVRREKNIKRVAEEDSIYKPIKRPERDNSKPLKIPKELQRQLPFKLKPKTPSQVIDSFKRVAVVKDKREVKVSEMMRKMNEMYQVKRKEKRINMKSRAESHQKRIKQQQMKFNLKKKKK